MLCKPKSFYDEKNKVAIGYKNPLYLTRAKQAQSAIYNGHVLVTSNHTPTVVHDSKDTREIAEITRKRMLMKMQSPLYENDRKKAETLVPKPISALTVYPPNTPVKLVPRVLPTKSQVKINLYVRTQPFFTNLTKLAKRESPQPGVTEGKEENSSDRHIRNDHFGAIMGYGDYVIGHVDRKIILLGGLDIILVLCRQFLILILEVAFSKAYLLLFVISLVPDLLKRGLPRLKFEKDHLCSACQLGKSKKFSHKPKSENTNMEVLHTLHMDLCGPMRVQSINGKKYILVIVDDYSRSLRSF
ncbi:integrase, catalytic region, zinc finger, CCHC-type containing protein [Tanacetum coccineum]